MKDINIQKEISTSKKILDMIRPVDLFVIFFFSINLIFLKVFPFMHSDESWLSGLSRAMMNEGLGTTEPFFVLMPRYPHAIKSLFHLMQMGMIKLFDYNLLSVRLLSLIFSCISLYAFYGLSLQFFSKKTSLIATIILSLDIQFIYISHFARQEIIILCVLIFNLYYFTKHLKNWHVKNDCALGLVTVLSIGIHPNSFIVALTIGGLYLYAIITHQKIQVKNLLILMLLVIAGAAIFIAISFSFNPTFLPDYFKYGDDAGTSRTITEKLFEFPKFYTRLFDQSNVTYYTPYIQPQFILFAGTIIVAAIMTLVKPHHAVAFPLITLIFINFGFLVVGRFSQPSAVFIFPFAYLILFILISTLKHLKVWIIGLILVSQLLGSVLQIKPFLSHTYDDYLESITSTIPSNENVLANLNTEYAFDVDCLYDYRDLDYLNENNLTFSDYIEQNNISYILYPEEMDYIYQNRPTWNVMYGNLFYYYDDMQTFFEENCVVINRFSSPYAMRIVQFSNCQSWKLTIYRVNAFES